MEELDKYSCSFIVQDGFKFTEEKIRELKHLLYDLVANKNVGSFHFAKTDYDCVFHKLITELKGWNEDIRRVHLRERYQDLLIDNKEFSKLAFDEYLYFDGNDTDKIQISNFIVLCYQPSVIDAVTKHLIESIIYSDKTLIAIN